MEKVLVLGVGSLAVYTAELAEECFHHSEVVGYLYLRDDIDISGYKIHGRPVYTISNMPEDCNVVVAIEDPYDKKVMVQHAEDFNLKMISLIHPSADVSLATIRDGCIIGRNVKLGNKAMIDRFVQIMDNVAIDEDSHIKSYITIEPGIHIENNSIVGVS